jgi:hypothetical protein
MNLLIFIQLFLFLILLKYISYVHSASSSSAFATSLKYKNPKVDKTLTNQKSKGAADDDTDVHDDGRKFIESKIEISLKSLLNNITSIESMLIII